jgi:hypothetical protein
MGVAAEVVSLEAGAVFYRVTAFFAMSGNIPALKPNHI